MKDFGLVNGSGIDLEGEALGIFAPQETASELDLACYAFGQNFNTTPVALISRPGRLYQRRLSPHSLCGGAGGGQRGKRPLQP